ncbi:MAG: WD40 repeat domain-containing protein [Flammeovirgaceae bacterium]
MSHLQVMKLYTLTGHRDCVYTLEPTQNSHFFFSAAGDGMVALWDLEQPTEGKLIAKLNNSIYALHVLPNNLLVVGHNYDGIHLLDWHQKKELASLRLTDSAIFDIKSVGNELWIAEGNGGVTVVDLLSFTIKTKIYVSEKSARVIAVSPSRQKVAIGYSDNYIRVFDASHYECNQEWQAHSNSVFALSFLPNGDLLSGSRDARLKLWKQGDWKLGNEVVAHLFAINHIALHPHLPFFATASMDKSIKIWSADTLQLLKVIDRARHAGHGTSVNKLWWSRHSQQLVSASDDRSISVWQIEGLH